MNKIGIVVLLSFFMIGCSAWDKGRAKTVEQKRDYLLEYGPQYVPGFLVPPSLVHKPPLSVTVLRTKLVDNGGETSEFLHRLVDKCFESSDRYCTVSLYYSENEKIESKRQKIANKNKQTSVKKGDLFFCRMRFNQASGPVDTSRMRVRVKDNVDSVGFLFPDDKQIISPKLEVIDSDSGERYGRAADGSITVSASYDGHAYAIQIFNTLPVSQFNGAVVTHTSALDFAGSIDVFDCKKVK